MFSPEGFETLATAYRRCAQAAYEWAKTQPPIEKPVYPGLFIDTGLDEEFRSGGYKEWLWSRFARHTFNQLYCVSPSGVVLCLDVESGGFFANLPKDFPEEIEEQKKLYDLAGDIFYWIDNHAFAIRQLHNDLTDEYTDTEGFQRKVMAPLIGRPVFWKPPKPKMSNQEFLEIILSAPSGDVPSQPSRRPVGRPAMGRDLELRTVVLSVFAERYRHPPETKKEAVWSEAQAWVKRHTGQDVGRTSIQTWLAPLWPARK